MEQKLNLANNTFFEKKAVIELHLTRFSKKSSF
jgi:hypothetical protein